MKAKEQFQFYVARIAKENFTAYEFSKIFNVDYQNTCKFYRDYKKLPTKIAWEIIEYMNAKVVVFRAK